MLVVSMFGYLFDDASGEVVGYGNGQVVLRDFPGVAVANQHARSAAGAQVRGIQHLVEPCGLAVGGEFDVPVVGLKAPRRFALEVRLGPGVKLGGRPALGGSVPMKTPWAAKWLKYRASSATDAA